MKKETKKRTLTEKQEKFCKAYIEKSNASEAYRIAYNSSEMKPETIHNKASLLMNKGEIRARIKELQEKAEARHDITVDSLLKELEEARIAALTAETPQSSAAVNATMSKAKLLGLDKQIIEQTVTNKLDISQMTNEDIIKELKANGYSEHEINRVIAGIEGKES